MNKSKSVLTSVFWQRYGISLLIFTGVVLLPYIFTPGHIFVLPDLSRGYDRKNLVIYTLMSGFFLYNYHYLVPNFYLTGKQRPYVFFLVLAFTVLILISALTNLRWGNPMPPPDVMPNLRRSPPPGPPPFLQIGHNVFIFISGVLMSLFLRTREHLQRIEGEKLQTELNFLKAQIQPHFLFNTLNSIYALVVQKNDHAADAVVMLSDFLRYIIREAGNKQVDLAKELQFIENYLGLQKARLGNTVALEYTLPKATEGENIAPLILFSFVENAFKHGVNPEEASCIKIQISLSQHVLALKVFNKKVHTLQKESGGIGVQNTRERLMHLYPHQHQLEILDNPQDYTVHLTINLA